MPSLTFTRRIVCSIKLFRLLTRSWSHSFRHSPVLHSDEPTSFVFAGHSIVGRSFLINKIPKGFTKGRRAALKRVICRSISVSGKAQYIRCDCVIRTNKASVNHVVFRLPVIRDCSCCFPQHVFGCLKKVLVFYFST